MSYKDILQEHAPRDTPKPKESSAELTTTDQGIQVLELDLRLANGDRWALPYAYKIAIKLDRSGELVISFTKHTVTLKGRNLVALYDELLRHSLASIQEQSSSLDVLPEGATVIRSIVVEET